MNARRRRETVRQVNEPVEQAAEQEVHLAQSPSGANALAVNTYVGLRGQAEDRRDGVEGERSVGGSPMAIITMAVGGKIRRLHRITAVFLELLLAA